MKGAFIMNRKLLLGTFICLTVLLAGCTNKQAKQVTAKISTNNQSTANTSKPKDMTATTTQPTKELSTKNDTKVSAIPVDKTVNFSTFDINKKYYNDVNGFAELKLKLPRLNGSYEGIPKINDFFASKEKFFYDELPLDFIKKNNLKVNGAHDNYYRSADYKLEAVFGNVISISADLNGGAGGVDWSGIEGDSFNLDTGKKLTLEDIFKVNKDEYMNSIYNFVSKKIMSDINNNKKSGGGSCYNFDDAYSGDGYKSIRSYDPDNFYLSKNSLVVFYPKYALTIGAGGPQKFEIPYESISNILDLKR